MVGQQSGHEWYGQCPALLGAHGGPSPQDHLCSVPGNRLGFVFVDDFAWLLRGPLAELHSTALLVVLLSRWGLVLVGFGWVGFCCLGVVFSGLGLPLGSYLSYH